MNTDLTVVIPAYNRERELGRCLDSIAEQSVAPQRVIVVDDGSTDGTADVARNHRLKPDVVEGRHLGAAAARNLGLEKVKTEWTMFFDSDDVMLPGHIEAAVSAVDSETDLIGWDVTYRFIDGRESVKPFEPRDIDWHNIMHGSLATQRYMARTSLFRLAGGWDATIKLWLDIELGARLLALGPRIKKIAGNRVAVIQSEVSITGMKWTQNMDHYDAVFEALGRSLGEGRQSWLDLKRAILAADIARENKDLGVNMFKSISRPSLAVRAAYSFRRSGLRGAARLFRPFFPR